MTVDARREEETLTQRRARILGFSYTDTTKINPKLLYKNFISNEDMQRVRVVPLRVDKGYALIGITNTTPQSALKSISDTYNDLRVEYSLISDTGFYEYSKLYNPPKQVVYENIELNEAGSDQLIATISNILNQVRADDMLAYLVSQAHRLNASDIHIETDEFDVRIRLRIDGVLHVIARIGFDKYRILLSAIASAGNISTGSNEAQQGHITQKIQMADQSIVDVNVRLETVPTINGIDVVMRLFNMDESMYSLDRLGLSEKEMSVVNSIITKPGGLVMIVGPTGSGKTTTLYSILNTLNHEDRKIITIEDPVEYRLRGVSQIPVTSSEHGDDSIFADKLRAILRLDPDIVMVGEVRDNDTARTALQAALTGHLVLTTFHASSASAALTRLSDIIGQNPLFVSAIRLIMAQRLVRRLDDTTKQAYDATDHEKNILLKIINTLPPGVERPSLDGLKLYKPGSSEGNPYGFSGQIALREQLTMTDSVVKVITTPGIVVKTTDIESAASVDGMLTMMQDAVRKVIDGQTTIEEVFRVLD